VPELKLECTVFILYVKIQHITILYSEVTIFIINENMVIFVGSCKYEKYKKHNSIKYYS